MSFDKTTYINNISEVFGSEIASIMEKEWKKYSDYGVKIRKSKVDGIIVLEKISYNGNPRIPSKVERVIYPIIRNQTGFEIPEACIIREEYKNGKLSRIKE